MIPNLVIFGASGDLTSRYLLPGLAELHEAALIPTGFHVLGLAQQRWDTETFRRHVRERLDQHAAHVAAASRAAVVAMLAYAAVDVNDADSVRRSLATAPEPFVAYLALPPSLAAPTVNALSDRGLAPESRVVLEKPFGSGLASAQALNRLLHRILSEQAVFRVDHFLQKEMVQNVLALRFANRLFESLWNRDHIERVEVIWDETLALEGRASYYDKAGALRDMIQNHLLQLLCLIAMEAPVTVGERDLRDRKVDVLRAVRTPTPEEIERNTVRARYGAGRIGDRDVQAYVDEPGVDAERGTETFAQVTLGVDNWRWAGVPFVLRSGKALGRNRQEVAVFFRPVPHLAFHETSPTQNILRLRFAPSHIAVAVNVTGPGERFDLACVELDAALPRQELRAYARVLHAALRGDTSLSIRADEAEEAWRIMEPILDAWAAGRAPLLSYPAGSDGPTTTGLASRLSVP